jgi:hypothetical protein
LDASKAFDNVKYVKLFELLKEKGICPMVARFLAVMYGNQVARVKWGDYISPTFPVINGVKQGGVLSPILFGIYIDELLTRLKNKGVGCHVGQMFLGALAYADDIILLAPTRHALQCMLSVARSYSAEYNINFNPNKSKLIVFSDDKNTNVDMVFDGFILKNSAKEKHLGNLVGSGIESNGIKEAIGDFYRRVNLTLSQFSNVRPHIRYKLFKSYCMIFYGCQLWDYASPAVQLVFTAWRKCVVSPGHNSL